MMNAVRTTLRRVDDFLLENDQQLAGVESFLRSLTYVLPGRMGHGAISECVMPNVRDGDAL